MEEISLHWCPTKEMVADFWTKPLQGSHFRKLRDYIMSRVRCVEPKADASSIGKVAKKKVAKVSGLRCSTVGGFAGKVECWHVKTRVKTTDMCLSGQRVAVMLVYMSATRHKKAVSRSTGPTCHSMSLADMSAICR
jgi:hypothetical protein